ncbi:MULTISPECIES: chondroitinase family polysaccharide lyase [Bacteroides]|uniref:chondroitinase family polysaccharide lyase n=1 Tax=Bacteroides TaxID=816 RepID=UPI000E4FDDB4|nr:MULTISPECIES: chondroitinase family polysaccharide lyase [Bacteroides]MBU8971419.1 chondroitinase [Bacteroides eggerthii]MBU8996039.1 chondroitinase [Bacteroides eggerthii]MCG4757491.1 chondroitinase [Bacteroides eggerthii]RHI75946.1 chondroitinase [Bacteroides eggerthii]
MMQFSKWTMGAGMLLGTLLPVNAEAQVVKSERLLSFEGPQVPAFISGTGSRLGISGEHYKDGLHSLSWTFDPGAVLSVKKDLKFEKKDPTGKDTYLSAFIVWVYNEEAQDKKIWFEFLKDGKKCTSFPFGINFTGWRAAWVCYERDMEGVPEEGMNEMRVIAPDVKGKLYLDHIILASKVDARQQAADVQVPFVNKGTTNHWLVIYEHSLWKPDMALTPVSEQQKREVQEIEKRFRDMLYTPSKFTDKELDGIRKKYDTYKITYKNGKVTGLPVFMVRQAEAYERMIPDWNKDMFTRLGMEMNEYFNLMKRIAIAYNNTSDTGVRDELKRKFLAMYDHITDQGVAYGSCWGNIHHYGYSMRGLFVSYFLMKDVLREAGKLKDAERTLNWYAITNEVYPKPTENGIDIDTFNTKLQGRIASILIMENSPEKLQYLRSFSRWLDYGCRPAPGLAGSFKTDGACFHHRNNYPAYAVGGLDGATSMIYLLSGTEFKLSELAHETVKNVLLTMRFYCNLKQWPLSMSGRHPNGKGELVPIQYATMAVAGTPDGKQAYDADMAAAYLRLAAYTGMPDKDAPDYLPKASARQELKMKELLEAQGFRPEPDPQGNLALGYGCVSVQRRDNWMAVVRGHSRYLWAAEHYLPANFYGRYLAHGSMQILTGKPGEMVTFTTSGWQENGFDWNRIPGVTSIHLPFEQLRAKVLNVDTFSGMEEMLYSDEAFAGGLSQARLNGNFGMKLHEHDKYNGSHRARKSFHFFGDMIVCLGTDIENTNSEFPTETTVFQLAAVTPEARQYWNACKGGGQTYIDPNGVGYYLSKHSMADAKYERNFPQVTVGERSAKPTSGDWVSLTLQHGKAPAGASYEYAVLPHTDAASLKTFAKNPAYRVLQQDRNAHIVHSLTDNITSYVLFETPRSLPADGLLQKADTSCLVMVRENNGKLLLTVSQPDLALYRGSSDEAFDKDGKRIERSIYSRPWIDNDSGEIPVTVTLKGLWQVAETPYCKLVSADKKQTVLRFTCRDAASFDVELRK